MLVKGKKISLRVEGNQKWVCAEWGKGSCLLANRDQALGWEEFEIEDVKEEVE